MAATPAIDRIDRRILAVLQADGRITNQALAERVALSPSACLARVRRLERLSVIRGYGARLDPWSLGASVILFAAIWLKRHHPADRARFEAAIRELPEVIEAAQVNGEFDYLLKLAVPDVPSWTRLAEAMVARDLGVDRIESHILMKESKTFLGFPVEP